MEEILNVLREADWEPSLDWKLMPVEFAEVLSLPQLISDFTTAIRSYL